MNIKNERKRSGHFLELALPFLPLIEQYKIASIPVSAIVLFIVIFFRQIKGKIFISNACRPYSVFLLYIIVRDFLHMMYSDGGALSVQVNRMIEYIVLYCLIFMACSIFDEDYLFKYWKLAGIIYGLGMIYHVVLIKFYNIPIIPITIIPRYKLRFDSFIPTMRPTSFFAEPAAYVSAMLPLLFLSLKRKNISWAILTTFLIVISTSTVGVLLSAALWIGFIFLEKKSLKVTALTIAIVLVFTFFFLNLDIFDATFLKFNAVVNGGSTFGSRIKAPLEVLQLMDFKNLIFGNNVLNVKDFVLQNAMRLPSDSAAYEAAMARNDVFLSTVPYLIFRYGIFGLFLFLFTFKGKIFNQKYGARLYTIMLLIAVFGQGNVAKPNINLILLIIYSINEKYENNCNK